MTDDTRVTEERARLIWKRAAELQAEAAARLEERSRLLAPGEEGQTGDFELADVRTAAVEAGISPEFVDLALAETKTIPAKTHSEGAEARAKRFLGSSWVNGVEVTRVIEAPPKAVYEALQRVLPSARYALLLVDTLGERPLEDGVFVFEPPSMWTQAGAAATFASRMGGIYAKRLYVSLRDIGGGRTELSIRAPVERGMVINYRVGAGASSLLGFFGGLAGSAIATNLTAALVAPVAAPIVLAATVAGLGVGGGGTLGLMRWTMRHAIRKAEEELTTLLQVLAASVRGAFPLPGIPEPSPTGLLGG